MVKEDDLLTMFFNLAEKVSNNEKEIAQLKKRRQKQDRLADKQDQMKKVKNKYADDVYMTTEEYQKLIDRFGEAFTEKAVDLLSGYIGSSGKKYYCHYKTILGWVKNRLEADGEKPMPGELKNSSNVVRKNEAYYMLPQEVRDDLEKDKGRPVDEATRMRVKDMLRKNGYRKC